MIGPDEIVYLDNNATTQLDPAALEEMLPFLTSYYGNPSSGYAFAAQVRGAIDLARSRVAALLGCEPAEIVFTSGGTEANNAAMNSALQLDPKRRHIVTTAVEHSAVRRHAEEMAKHGCEVTFVGVGADGALDLAELDAAIRPDTAIVSIMWANNETGVLFPIDSIAEIAARRRVLLHTDAVQVAGKIAINLARSHINSVAISAHKLHGPKGVGALFVGRHSRFRPSIIGGSHENGRRAGTENVAAIVGFGKAAERATAELHDEQTRVLSMRDRFEAALLEKVPGASLNGDRANRLPNTTNLSFEGIESDAALMLLDRQRICCSAGSACRTGSLQGSHVLRAMGLSEEQTRASLRFSFGRFNTEAEVDKAIDAVPAVIAKLRAMSPAASLAPTAA
jgi:cysteine desulfurase